MKKVVLKHETPTKLDGLTAGVKYRLRVYAYEQPDVTSEYVTFETSGGEGWLYKKYNAEICCFNACSRII